MQSDSGQHSVICFKTQQKLNKGRRTNNVVNIIEAIPANNSWIDSTVDDGDQPRNIPV